MDIKRKTELEALCQCFRKELIELLHARQTGHPGGSLSVCEILTALYFEKAAVRPNEPDWEGRDRIILTKGHAAPMLYIALAHRGFFGTDELKTLRTLNSRLQGHPSAKCTPGVELSTGPLGVGLSAALGMALALKAKGGNQRVYAVMGDGELDEGAVWEACMSAAKFRADNLIAIIDNNGVQLDGTNSEIMPLGDLSAKFAAFGWKTITCCGHDIEALCEAIDEAKNCADAPVVIIAKTVKGKGVSFMENKSAWHGRPISDREFAFAMKELEGGI